MRLVFGHEVKSGAGRRIAMSIWKNIFLRSAGFGAGIAVIVCLTAGGWIWYHSRPTSPKPWNSTAIKAEFDRLDIEGEKSTFAFYYVLENTTNFDYRLSNGDTFQLRGMLANEKGLAESSATDSTLELPTFLPPKLRARVIIHLPIPYTGQKQSPTDKSDVAGLRSYRKALADFVNKNMGNLDGFTIFDEANRYEIQLPKGW
jgi:hypothetical protein